MHDIIRYFQHAGDVHNKPDEAQNETVKSPSTTTMLDHPPRDFASPAPADAPLFVVNHNIQHPAAPPSPFHHFSHSRIRTESLCSIKSNRDVTMANLQPRKNIRTEDQKIIDIKRESRERLSNKDIDKSQLRMFDMIYFNPQNNPMKPRSPNKIDRLKKSEVKQEQSLQQNESLASAIQVPQLKIDANGDMVIDETSLVVENEQQKKNRIELASSNVVYDDDLSGNYGYYKRQKRTKEWPHDETVKFYRCLNTIGTDFSLMLNLFPNRSRRDLKLKFKKEERTNPHLIDKAVLKHNTFDLDVLQRELEQEEDERKKAAKAARCEVKELVKSKILKKQEAKLKAEQQGKTNIAKILSGGDLSMSIVDNNLDVKENLQVAPRARQSYKKKSKAQLPVKEEPTPNIMDVLVRHDIKLIGSITKSGKPRKKPVIDIIEMNSKGTSEEQPPLKKARKSQKTTPKVPVIQEVTVSNDGFQPAVTEKVVPDKPAESAVESENLSASLSLHNTPKDLQPPEEVPNIVSLEHFEEVNLENFHKFF